MAQANFSAVRSARVVTLLGFSLLIQISSFSSVFQRCGRLENCQSKSLLSLNVATSDVEGAKETASSFKKLPVTVLSGFLGAGKTTLLQHILKSDHNGKRYAVIVNDMSELNIDGSLIQPHVQQQEEKVIEMTNGCICCTLREDLLKEVASLARQDRFDHLIIESTGVSEPLPVAETFSFKTEDGQGESLLDIANIDSMVTVIDAVNFMKDMQESEDLKSKGLQADDDDSRTLTDLLVSQVEFASVIVINKCDLVTPLHLQKVKAVVRALNGEAKVLESVRSKIDISEIIGSNTYNFEKVSQSAAWIKAINGDHDHNHSELEEFGISSFVYRGRKPFHPERLMEFITEKLGTEDDDEDEEEEGAEKEKKVETKEVIVEDKEVPVSDRPHVIRSKGFFWLASRTEEMMLWSQAGGLFQLSPGGDWWIDTPKDMWPDDAESVQQIEDDWVGENGDKRQELVFIGTNLVKESILEDLDACLLTDEEMLLGADAWASFEDPFPASPSYGHSHDHEHNCEGEGCQEVDCAENVTMILPSAAKIIAQQNE